MTADAGRTAVERYFTEMGEIYRSGGGTEETSYYSAFENLANAIGKDLKPRVRCIMQLRNTGAGNPDGGFYSADQIRKGKDETPMEGQKPERGVIEIKPLKDNSWVTAEGKQVTRYWGHYGQVLVTNYRDFVFVGQDADGQTAKLETYSLADSDRDFWKLTQHPQKAAKEHGERLVEYLKRVMLYTAVLKEPEELAWFLAS